jgi:hypothetical protein
MTRSNLLVRKPSKSTQDKQLPIIFPHADILDGLVDDLGFHCQQR